MPLRRLLEHVGGAEEPLFAKRRGLELKADGKPADRTAARH
jgi:hypothetical protein